MSRREWAKEKKEALLDVLKEIVANGGRVDCGQFIARTIKRK